MKWKSQENREEIFLVSECNNQIIPLPSLAANSTPRSSNSSSGSIMEPFQSSELLTDDTEKIT